jgi:hypothetical protein
MFKSIISKIKTFGQTVVNRIVGFIGGIIGIKPEAIQIPAPPEVTNEVSDTAESKTEEKKEGLIKKACTAVKKAAKAAIKAVEQALITSAQLAYVTVRLAAPFYICSLAWEYAQAQGLVALFIGMWQMGTIPYMILCILIAIGVGATLITIETLWSFLLQPIRRFLFRPAQKKQIVTPVTDAVETLNQQLVNIENRLKGIEANSGDIEISVEKETASFIANVVKQSVEQAEKRLNDRLTNLEKAIAPKVTTTAPAEIATPEVITAPAEIATPTPVEVVVDICPTTPTEEVKPEIVPVVIEEVVTEVVDIRPTPEPLKINNTKQLKNQLIKIEEKEIDSILMSYRASDLKKIIQSLNQSISDGLNKGSTREDKKTVLVSEIKKQLQYFKKFAVAA